MDDEELRRRFSVARVARLATVRADGSPHIVPVCFALEGDTVVTAVDDVKRKRSAALSRLDHVRANPRVTMLVDHYDEDWTSLWWVRADGVAQVVEAGTEHEAAIAALAEKYEQYRERPPSAAAIIVQVDRFAGWAAGA